MALVSKSLRIDEFTDNLLLEYIELSKDIFGEAPSMNSLMGGLIIKGMISNLNELEILFNENTTFMNDEDRQKIESCKDRFSKLLNSLEVYNNIK